MRDEVEAVLFDADRIATRVRALGEQLARDYLGAAPLTLVPILTGSVIFLADLIRALPLWMRIELVSAASYLGSTAPQQEPALGSLPERVRVEGAHVLIVDDILDTGATLRRVRAAIAARAPASVAACVLLRKDKPHETHAEYAAFDIPDRFVVGYGLDHDGYYRNLPEIVTLRAEAGV